MASGAQVTGKGWGSQKKVFTSSDAKASRRASDIALLDKKPQVIQRVRSDNCLLSSKRVNNNMSFSQQRQAESRRGNDLMNKTQPKVDAKFQGLIGSGSNADKAIRGKPACRISAFRSQGI